MRLQCYSAKFAPVYNGLSLEDPNLHDIILRLLITNQKDLGQSASLTLRVLIHKTFLPHSLIEGPRDGVGKVFMRKPGT